MTEEEKIDQLVSMLDNFMIEGGGHMNIESNEKNTFDSTPNVNVSPTNECTGNKPCSIPNMKDDSIDKN